MAAIDRRSEENVELTHRIADEIWNEGRMESVEELYAENVLVHHESEEYHGLSEFKEFVSQSRSAFPDVRLDIEDVMVDGDLIACHYRWRGTNDGRLDMFDHDATGRSVDVSGLVMARFEDGKVVEEWNYGDMMGMAGQLGLLPKEMGA